jgi:hypothetical protein
MPTEKLFIQQLADVELTGNEVSVLRKHFYDTIELLRSLPRRALEVEGRGGWSDVLEYLYRGCLCPIHWRQGSYQPYPDLFVELRTGVLIAATQQLTSAGNLEISLERVLNGEVDGWSIASDGQIAACLLDQLDVSMEKVMDVFARKQNVPLTHSVDQAIQLKERHLNRLEDLMRNIPADEIDEWRRWAELKIK